MFSVYKVSLNVYSDPDQTTFPNQNLASFSKEIDDSTVTGFESTTINLAASGSQSINLNGISNVTSLFIYSDTNDCTLTINGNAMTLKAGIPGLMPIAITSLSITNLSSTTVTNVTIMLIAG